MGDTDQAYPGRGERHELEGQNEPVEIDGESNFGRSPISPNPNQIPFSRGKEIGSPASTYHQTPGTTRSSGVFPGVSRTGTHNHHYHMPSTTPKIDEVVTPHSYPNTPGTARSSDAFGLERILIGLRLARNPSPLSPLVSISSPSSHDASPGPSQNQTENPNPNQNSYQNQNPTNTPLPFHNLEFFPHHSPPLKQTERPESHISRNNNEQAKPMSPDLTLVSPTTPGAETIRVFLNGSQAGRSSRGSDGERSVRSSGVVSPLGGNSRNSSPNRNVNMRREVPTFGPLRGQMI